jgi:hypothetical protein
MIDKNVEAVCKKMVERSYIGLRKYGTNTERTDIDLAGWVQHLQEEMMDACIYLERIKHELTSSPTAYPKGDSRLSGKQEGEDTQ